MTAMADIANQAGKEPWPSLESASWVFDRASWILVISLAIGLSATVAIVWMGVVKEHHWDLLREKAAKQIASVELATAKANKQAAEAQLALEKYKAPRSISPEQRNRIAEEMKQFKGQQYFGMVASDIADAWDIWREISLSLEIAEWKRLPPPGLQATQYGPPAGIALAPQAGVMILASVANDASENMRLYDLAKILAARLTDRSIIAGAGFTQSQYPNTIAIVIGPKP